MCVREGKDVCICKRIRERVRQRVGISERGREKCEREWERSVCVRVKEKVREMWRVMRGGERNENERDSIFSEKL